MPIIRKVIPVVFLKPVVIIKRQILLSFSFSSEKLIPKHSRDSNPNPRPSHHLIGSGLKMSLNLRKRNGFFKKIVILSQMSFCRYNLYHFYQLSQFPKYYDSFKEDLPVCDQKKIAKCL